MPAARRHGFSFYHYGFTNVSVSAAVVFLVVVLVVVHVVFVFVGFRIGTGVLLLVSVRHRVHSVCTARTEVIKYAKRSGETPRIVFGRWTSNLQRGARRLCRNSLMFFLGTERNITAAQTQ